ncbi:MAG: hypothetical protein ACOCXS_01385 [Bacteroidota bacterium]
MRKVVSYVLTTFVLVLTVIALLGIWNVIELEDVLRKVFLSLLVIFGASAVILFVYHVVTREPNNYQQHLRQQQFNPEQENKVS